MSTTDDAEYARLATHAEHVFPATGTRTGLDGGPETAPPDGSPAPPVPWPYGPFLAPLPSGPGVIGGTSRGHPGGPGFAAGHDVPAGPGEGPVWSVWQHAQRAWHTAGAEWHTVSAGDLPTPADEASPLAPAADGPTPADEASPLAPAADAPPPAGGTSPLASARDAPPAGPFPASPAGPFPASPAGPLPASPAAPSSATPSKPAPDRKTRRGRLLGAVAAFAVVAAGSGYALGTGGPAARHYPAARVAGAVFGADVVQPGQGVAQAMGHVAGHGGTTVAVGSQAGGDIPRAQFFVSRDDGKTWDLAAVTASGGGAPAPGHAAGLVTRGRNGWLAVGPDAIWTSATGESWTLASTAGITPADAADQLTVLAPMGSGFVAVGQNPAEGTAVVWTSPDGRHWQRMTAHELGLPAGSGTVTDLTAAATRGREVLLSGHITAASGSRTTATWLSTDDGQTWTWAPVPIGHGATAGLTGIASGAAGFVAIRPGSGPQGPSALSRPDGVVYVSGNGTSWRYVATLTAASGVQFGTVSDGPGGFAALGQGPGGDMAAYVSADGVTWRPGIAFGPAPASATGVTVTPGGTVVVTGSTGAAGRQQPYLALAAAGQAARAVPVASIPGGTISQVSVDAVAVSGHRRVAVGEAGGSPAIWTATGSSWSSAVAPGATSRTAASAAAPPASAATLPASAAAPPTASAATPTAGADAEKLTSVVHGRAGWLATGEAVSGAAQRPLLLTSSDGTRWNASPEGALPGADVAAAQAAAGPAGYVVVGDETTSAGTFPAAWWSRDRRTWRPAGGPASGGAAGDDPGEMLGVTAGPSGFVAAGAQGISPAVWTSRDGGNWRLATLRVPGGAASADLRQVAVSGPHVVALGEETWPAGARTAFAEVSANGGRTWRPVTLPAPRGDAVATALTPMRGGFTAVGAYGTPGHRDVVVWTSADGGAWTTQIPNGPGLSGDGSEEITGLAASGNGSLTGVGFTASASAEQPTLWDIPAR